MTGGGQDVIHNIDTSGSSRDIVDFGAGIGRHDLWFAQDGDDLRISRLGTRDTVHLTDWFDGADPLSNRHAQFNASGETVSAEAIQSLVDAMASFSIDNAGFDPTANTFNGTHNNEETLIAAIDSAWQ